MSAYSLILRICSPQCSICSLPYQNCTLSGAQGACPRKTIDTRWQICLRYYRSYVIWIVTIFYKGKCLHKGQYVTTRYWFQLHEFTWGGRVVVNCLLQLMPTQFGSNVKSFWSIALDFKVICKSKVEFQQYMNLKLLQLVSVNKEKKNKLINKLCCFISYQVPCLFYLA